MSGSYALAAALRADGHVLLMVLLSIGLLLLLMALRAWMFRPSARQRRHRRYRRQAERTLQRLPQLAGDGQRMAYLRKINPYVFEELLLLAFERQGLTVVRNATYSGDGGIDGQVFIDGECWLIQAKRYSHAIKPQHVFDFAALLVRKKCPGLLIHTGRTGPQSRHIQAGITRLRIISGQLLLDLLSGQPVWKRTT